ncbi:HD-GYP domain-containing protein [uncultured Selenomonas sp.]|uniref:HD-GYP domain-containing protein n=1 Tax=uncultured Selenomonas sp. TaxID=159275 RepID=UPI00262B0C6A|nr:HD-GYP domain-containing protein [uncultured Selenomonas sp.]
MIRLKPNQLKTGMVTAQSIFNEKGAPFLVRGTPLTDRYIYRLRQLSIPELHVTSLSSNFQLQPPPDIVEERTRVQAVDNVAETFREAEENGRFDMTRLEKCADFLVRDIMAKKKNLVQITDIRLHDSYTFSHSVNVAVLSTMLGDLCGYSKRKLQIITLGGLLHDIGKLAVPTPILNKSGSLTAGEFKIIRRHPSEGRKILKELTSPIASILAIIAVQHHEHLDGSGYPYHVRGKSIHPYSRITAIADVYDALTSVRPYKRAYKPNVVYRMMMQNSPGHFDMDRLRLFFDNVAIYPVGTVMKTQLGYAIVKKVVFGHTLAPVVIVFADKNGNLLKKPFGVNLAHCRRDAIHYVMDDVELLNFIRHTGIDPAVFLDDDLRAMKDYPRIGKHEI